MLQSVGSQSQYDLETEQQDIVKMEYSKNAPFFPLFLKFLKICLAVLSLSCGTWDL